jgi:fumarate reductase flavoprotein subunit
MSGLNRRTFLKLIGGSTAALGLGLSSKSSRAQAAVPKSGMKEIETDVAVIGGGCAGMAAAATAAELGMRVAVFEKQDRLAMGGMGPFAVESRLQKERRMTFTVEDAFKYYMKHTHYHTDAKLVKAYLSKSASTIDWFEGMGIKFADVIAYYPGARYVWHYKSPEDPSFTDVLATQSKARGTIIYMETPAKELTKRNGRITGLIAENKSGEALRVNTDAVIIGTGGFAENVKWVEKYTKLAGYPLPIIQGNTPMLNGDGIRMAWDVGAGETEMVVDTYRGLPQPYGGPGGTAIELGTFRQPILMVNLLGERFVNEEVVFDGAFAGNAVDAQKGRCAFGIFDEDTNRYYEENQWDWPLAFMPNDRSKDVATYIKKIRDEGYKHVFIADSVEDLCAQTGIHLESLRKTLDKYNKACDTGRDDLFYKRDKYLKPVRRPKFYVGRFMLNWYGSLGGVKINHKTEVLTKDFDVIPGLYTAGNDSNTVCGATYVFYLAGHMSGFAYNTGRIAGENASEYVKKRRHGHG